MILVNNPGSFEHAFAPLRHAAFDGCTPTDLIFPFFLVIVGASISLSRKPLATASDLRPALARIFRRTLLLYVVGLLLSGFPRFDGARSTVVAYDFETIRLLGVLPRIALCYGFVALLTLIRRQALQWAVVILLLLAYAFIVRLVDVPGFGKGQWTLEGNALGWIDRTVFGARHLHDKVRGFDPEGLGSTLTAILNTFLGFHFGAWLFGKERSRRELTTANALLLGLAVLALVWSRIPPPLGFPLNKPLWSPSYALWTSAIGLILLCALHVLVDRMALSRGFRPAIWFGKNALILFVLSGVLARCLGLVRIESGGRTVGAQTALFNLATTLTQDQRAASLAVAAVHVLFWTGIAAVLHRKRWFVRL